MFLLQNGVWYSRSESCHGGRRRPHEWPHNHPDNTGRLTAKVLSVKSHTSRGVYNWLLSSGTASSPDSHADLLHSTHDTKLRCAAHDTLLHLYHIIYMYIYYFALGCTYFVSSISLERVSVATWRRVLRTLRSEALWLATMPGPIQPAAAAASALPAWLQPSSLARVFLSTSSLTSPRHLLW